MYLHPFLDFNALNKKMMSNKVPSNEKLPYIYEKLGGEFFDNNRKMLKGAKVAIVGAGGLPFQIKEGELFLMGNKATPLDIKEALLDTMGISAMMSYLNPNRRSLKDLANKTLEVGHNSIKHTVFFNVLIVGHSIGVEHELSSQRDLVHLSRLTVARTKAQDTPCLTLLSGEQLDLYEKVLNSTTKLIEESKIPMLEETRNLLFPTAKSSMVMLSGSLRNFEKLIDLKNSDGKELELCLLLDELEKAFNWLY